MHAAFHAKFGFCPWTLLTVIVLVALVAVLVVHTINQKKRQAQFEAQLAEKNGTAK